MWKEVVIARKDLSMSPGKLSGQISHGSAAFLTTLIRDPRYTTPLRKGHFKDFDDYSIRSDDTDIVCYHFEYDFDKDLYEQWISGTFTKVVLEARNKNHLLKAKAMAEALGMKEGEDFFLIKDCCFTELVPEEYDENGIGRTLTCIGFKPMPSEIIDQIGKKYQLYK